MNKQSKKIMKRKAIRYLCETQGIDKRAAEFIYSTATAVQRHNYRVKGKNL